MRGGAAFSALLLALLVAAPCRAGDRIVTIGTAGELGVYYPAGGAICRLVKRGAREHGIHCFARATQGSVYNLKALRTGDLDLALVQGDWLFHAYKGSHEFAKAGPNPKLRSVFSLHTEMFTVLARADAGIASVRDLAGKRIGIGDAGSGMRATADEFIHAEGWNARSFAALIHLPQAEQEKALCSGKVTALLFTTGHPNGNMQDITQRCNTRLVPVEGPEIDKLLKKNPYYLRMSLPAGMYPGSPSAVPSFGVKAVLATSSEVDDEVIYHIVKAVFDNLDNFKTLHPVFATLDKQRMREEGLVVPLHPGALRYFKETGLIK